MPNSIDSLFAKLRADKRKALMPFTTAGDPDLEFTAELIHEFAARGAHVCEVGIPYSDPIADGPVIQASYTRALAKKIKLAQIFDALGHVAPKLSMPVVTMISYAIVYRHGLAAYLRDAKKAGVAGAIVPDLPVEESADLAKECRAADFSLIQLVTPTTPRERAIRIAETSTGFLYYVSVTGITGERTQLPPDLVENVSWVRQRTQLPICIGFGIGTADNVRTLAPVADGLIVGSAIVRRVAQCETKSKKEVLADVGNFVGELLAAMQ